MRKTNNIGWLICVTLLVIVASSSAVADSYELILSPGNCGTGASCNGYTFTTNVAQQGMTNNYDVSFDVHNTSGVASYFQGFGLTLFSGSVSGSSASLAADPALASGITLTLVANDKFNNGNTRCGPQASNTGSVCVDVTSANGIYIGGPGSDQKISFVLTLSGGAVLDSWHIMADATKLANGKGGNVFALSNDGTPTPPVQTPEPASMVLMALGLAGTAAFRRRNK